MAVDQHGKLTHTNRKMQQLLGYSTEELADRRRWLLAAFPDPPDHQEAELYFGAVAAGSPPEGRTLLTVRRKDGSQRVLEFWSTPLLIEAQRYGAVTIAFDVTDRQRLEQQLIRAERLAAIGELAASLAHEVRNPLAGIIGAIQIMRSQMPTEDSRREVLEEVLHQMGRLDSTMRDLLIYSRPKPLEPRRCRIEQVVDRVLTVVAAEPGFRRMQIIKNYSDEMPEIELDPDQMEQVCMNIVLNGAQAMESGGRITIASHADNSQVVLSFTDDGAGMSPFQIRRAFEPFFTTKSRGTGLGLCICKRIVEAHGGSIRLDSRPGEGTCVTISLPTQFVGVGRSQRRTESTADPDAA
jgi:PAS domain S-box-containing protein